MACIDINALTENDCFGIAHKSDGTADCQKVGYTKSAGAKTQTPDQQWFKGVYIDTRDTDTNTCHASTSRGDGWAMFVSLSLVSI